MLHKEESIISYFNRFYNFQAGELMACTNICHSIKLQSHWNFVVGVVPARLLFHLSGQAFLELAF